PYTPTLSLHDALPIYNRRQTYRHVFSPQEPLRIEILRDAPRATLAGTAVNLSITGMRARLPAGAGPFQLEQLVTVRLLTFSSTPDRKSTRLNSSHSQT